MKYIFIILFPVLLFSQQSLQIKIVDENNLPVSRVIVSISQEDDQVAFGTTDANGFFEKQLPLGSYSVSIKKLGFSPITELVSIQKNEVLRFIILPETNQLKNVIISSRPKLMKIKEDTISYNMKAVVDGTENKIEDVIKKLPGLDVDQDGKVMYKGQRIDNVLIDGNEFFGNKHQMATQNIDAAMIEAIDLLTSYSGFAIASGGKKGIALNLKTKDSYKNKWVMDFELALGINKSLRLHSNSFKFFKKGNVAILSDYNTIAKTPISREDYNEMKVVSDVDSENGEIKEIETPTFLNSNTFIKDKKNAFIALNYTSLIAKRSKITFFNIFNKMNVSELSTKTQTSIGDANTTLSFLENKNAVYSLNNSSFKWEFNKSETTFISYVAGFNPNSDADNQDLIRAQNKLEYKKNHNNTNFAHILRVQTKFFKTINYKFIAKHSFDNNHENLYLLSQEEIFNTTFDKLDQKGKLRDKNFSFYNFFTWTKNSNFFTLKINFLSHQQNFENLIFQNNKFDENIKLKNHSIQTNLSWLKNWNSNFQSITGINSTTSKVRFKESNAIPIRYEPNLSLIYSLTSFNKITFSYIVEHQLPTIYQLQESDIINDFQTIQKPSRVNFSQITPKNSYSLQYLNVNPKNFSVIFANMSYAVERNTVSNNTIYKMGFIEDEMITTKESSILRGLAMYDLKFKSLPISIKSTLFFIKSTGDSQFMGLENKFVSRNFTNRFQLMSNFKKSNVQFGLEYNFSTKTIEQSQNNFKNTSQTHQVLFSLRGKNKDYLKWDLGFTVDNQDSGYYTNKVFFLNGNVQYTIAKDWKLFFTGNNMLNLNNTQLIKTSYNQSVFTESKMSLRPGYMMLGLNYSL